MKRLLSAVLAASALFLGGCSVSIETLLSPPKLDEEQSAIYNALTLSKGSDVDLKYPVSGQYRSAFVVRNIDDEETDEAIVFYEVSNVTDGGSSLRLNFLDKQNDEWVSVYDFAALGSEIERVQFADLGDSEVSVIVTYSIQNSSDSATSIFKYKDNVPTEVYKSRHTYMSLVDINEDGADEVFLINHDRSIGAASVYLLGWTESNAFSILSASPLNENYAECKNIVNGVCDEDGNKAIYVDYLTSEGALSTDIFMCRGRSFIQSQIRPEQLVRRINTYTPSIFSQDIDDDGIIEVPGTSPFGGYENLTKPEQINMTYWYQLREGGNFVKCEYFSYMSIRSDYVFFIPSRWTGLITVNVSIADGTATFSQYDSRNKEVGEELMVIRALPEASVEKADLSGFVSYGKSEKTGYCFYIRNDTENTFALTEAELSDCFKILN